MTSTTVRGASPAPSLPSTSASTVHASIITAERVPLSVPLAGLGERAIASLIDFMVVLMLGLTVLFIYTAFLRGDIERDLSAASTVAVVLAVGTALFGIVLYDVIGDVFFQGRTPGKRLTHLRVIDAAGRPPDLVTSLLRNLLRLVDMIPVGYGVGLIVMFFTGTRRLGDLVAGTVVVSERSLGPHPVELLQAAAGVATATGVTLDDDDVARIVDTLRRTVGLEASLAARSTARVLASLGGRAGTCTPQTPTSPVSPTAHLAAAVLAAAAQGQGFAARLLRLYEAERALKEALARLDAARGRDGDAIAIALDLATRHASSELMSAARRGIPSRLVESLSVTLLDLERRRRAPSVPVWPRLTHFFAVDVPTAVWAERRGIVRAGVVLAVSAATGFGLAFVDPSLGRALIGDALTELVEEGANWTNRIEADGHYLQASLQIIANNIGVGVRVFALGILGGVATVLGLVTNGVSIGATFGSAVRLGTHDTLMRFIVAHGPVELTMVAVAGAAGFCLGRAVLSPGERTRVQALREEGRQGFLLATFATVGFLVIGTVEGFVSPGAHFTTSANVAVGVGMWLVFFGWARQGRQGG